MQSITENKLRIGNFTSSEIYRLMGTPAVRKTYIEEKKIERRLGRSIDVEAHSQPMAWGNLLETRVFDLLGLEYEITSKDTTQHPTIDFWTGTKDLIVVGKKIAEIKCYQPKKFALYTDAILSKDIQVLKKDFAQEFWQIVSNAIINQVPSGEAISYCPYKSELDDIRDLAANYDGFDQWKYRFIVEKEDAGLAYIPDGGYYKNLNRFEFVVPENDIAELTERVEADGKSIAV